MVHGRHHGRHRVGIGKGQHRHLFAGQKLFYHYLVAAFAEDFILHNGMNSLFGLFQILSDNHAFAQRQSVGLNDCRETVLPLDIFHYFAGIVEHLIFCGGNAVFFHQVFGKHLTALDLGRFFAGAESGDPCFFHRVGHSQHQWIIRGDHCEIDALFFRKGNHALHIGCFYIHRRGLHADAAVARRTVNAFDLRVFCQLFNHCVLPAAGTNY